MSARICRSDRGARCVRGRMPNAPRASVLAGTHAIPEVAMDYCFLAKDGSGTPLTVLVLKDRSFS
eukprot:12965023-Alexandrium_andersonii.AAC.1